MECVFASGSRPPTSPVAHPRIVTINRSQPPTTDPFLPVATPHTIPKLVYAHTPRAYARAANDTTRGHPHMPEDPDRIAQERQLYHQWISIAFALADEYGHTLRNLHEDLIVEFAQRDHLPPPD